MSLTCDNCGKSEVRGADEQEESPWIRGYIGIYGDSGRDPQRGWDACRVQCVPGAVAKALGALNPAWRPTE